MAKFRQVTGDGTLWLKFGNPKHVNEQIRARVKEAAAERLIDVL